jgi:TonB family protein
VNRFGLRPLKVLASLFIGVTLSIHPVNACFFEAAEGNPLAMRSVLYMRVFDTSAEGPYPLDNSISSSFTDFAAIDDIYLEEEIYRDKTSLMQVFNLKNVNFITEVDFEESDSKPSGKYEHSLILDGRAYLFVLTSKTQPERLFGISIYELGEEPETSLLDSEIVLPEDKSAIFGFRTIPSKTYFVSLRAKPISGGKSPEPYGERDSAMVVKVQGRMPPPLRIKYVAPEYPDIAKRAHIDGVIMLAVIVDERGKVESIRVLRSVPLIDEVAMAAVKQWQYKPLMVDGIARKAGFTVSLRISGEGMAADVSNARIPVGFVNGSVRIEEETARRWLMKCIWPTYPQKARQGRVEGIVVLGVRVNEKGLVEDAVVLRSIPVFDKAALAAVKQWEYRPPLINGDPRKISFIASIKFILN